MIFISLAQSAIYHDCSCVYLPNSLKGLCVLFYELPLSLIQIDSFARWSSQYGVLGSEYDQKYTSEEK